MLSAFAHHRSKYIEQTQRGTYAYQGITEPSDLEIRPSADQNLYVPKYDLQDGYEMIRGRMKLWISSVKRKVVGFYHFLVDMERPRLHLRLRDGWEYEP